MMRSGQGPQEASAQSHRPVPSRRKEALRPDGRMAMHSWLRSIEVVPVSGAESPLLNKAMEGLLSTFETMGHVVSDRPTEETDILLTTALFDQPLDWRQALMFMGRRRFGLEHAPTVFTLVHIRPDQYLAALEALESALRRDVPQPVDYAFRGLASQAHRVLHEQGQRGGPLLALERIVQAQAKCIRVILIVGEEVPLTAFHFDLVGAHPRTDYADPVAFYSDICVRTVTAVSTREVNDHVWVDPPVTEGCWRSLKTPSAMCEAGRQLARRGFFTDTVFIPELAPVPAVGEAISAQYSEGCFATWEPKLDALIATVTGSARPVHKGSISEEDLAVLVGLASGNRGALVQPVAGRANAPPSTEAVEMLLMDENVPRIKPHALPETGQGQLPVIRSKLHGHRSVAAYAPAHVEYVPLEAIYQRYPVSCGTDAQADAMRRTFGRSAALRSAADARKIVFTLLPGHGTVIAEKWVADKRPLQLIWEYMDAGYLEIASRIPQGTFAYRLDSSGRNVLEAPDRRPDDLPALDGH